jgi:hypothetical protein
VLIRLSLYGQSQLAQLRNLKWLEREMGRQAQTNGSLSELVALRPSSRLHVVAFSSSYFGSQLMLLPPALVFFPSCSVVRVVQIPPGQCASIRFVDHAAWLLRDCSCWQSSGFKSLLHYYVTVKSYHLFLEVSKSQPFCHGIITMSNAIPLTRLGGKGMYCIASCRKGSRSQFPPPLPFLRSPRSPLPVPWSG